MTVKQKLELTWIGKEKRPRLEPRILLEEAELSHHASFRRSNHDIYDNKLIYGDNLLTLKALEQDYTGKIKCVFIDPPYNTGSAFEHYDDGLEHSIWLGLMRDRLEILRNLLCDDGFFFVQIDYREGARLKLLLDEVFGQGCFRNEIIVRRGTKNVQSQFKDIDSLSSGHDTIYLYSKTPTSRLKKLFSTLDEQQPGKWDTFWRGTDRPTMRYELFGIMPKRGQWRWKKERAFDAKANFETYNADYSNQMSLDEYWHYYNNEFGEEPDFIRLGPDGAVQYYVGPRDYKLLSDVWIDVKAAGKITDFPHEKHEELLHRIIDWVTVPGELVLDSFAGSGTTGAVAQKMGRRWIMIELGEHAHTHIVPRLKKVIDGEDQGGISKAVDWKGGGGFRYYKLAPSLLEKDKWGRWVISKKYNAAMLSEAVCKFMGFHYEPSETLWWIHGRANESAYIYVTTQSIDQASMEALSEEVGPDRSLLICCGAFLGNADRFKNLTVTKIPRAVMSKCEWGQDDYSLNIQNLPMLKPEPETPVKKTLKTEPSLFDDIGE